MTRVLLCVDLSNQVYRAAHVFAGLTSDERFTGGLYGFIAIVQKAIKEVGATDIVICTDTKPYLRTKVYPEYKSLRKETQDELLAEDVRYSITLIKEFLSVVGWPLWSLLGFESDDLVAHAVRKYGFRYDLVVAQSNDSDLYQLFEHPRFLIYKGKGKTYSRADYEKEWKGITAEQFVTAHALIGTHNEVEGIRGIGPATAIDLVQHPEKLRNVRAKYVGIVDRNIQLIRLPHADLPYTERIPDYTRRYVERDLLRFCGRYDITLTQEMCVAFAQVGK